nr:IS3 family transposase [Bacteroides coprosuis]
MQELRQQYDLATLLDCGQMARSTFYYHIKPQNKSSKENFHIELIKNIYQQHKGLYGYRRITAQLRKMGYLINHKKVLKIMNQLDIKGKRKEPSIRNYNKEEGDGQEISENLINRDFHADQPYRKWATDLTQIKIKDKWLYLSPILDMYNGEIISYSLSNNPTTKLVIETLDKAFKKVKSVKGIIIHSDRGMQYQSKEYRKALVNYKMTPSMSRKGNCYDNAMMESFFGSLKLELIYNQRFESEQELIQKIHQYIDYYNNIRIKNRLKGMSPVEYRTHHYGK